MCEASTGCRFAVVVTVYRLGQIRTMMQYTILGLANPRVDYRVRCALNALVGVHNVREE